MRTERKDRRSLIDRLPLSEFFALICTGLMLLTLFLLSSVGEPRKPGASISAGAGIAVKAFPLTEPEVLTDEEGADRQNAKIPSRGLNRD